MLKNKKVIEINELCYFFKIKIKYNLKYLWQNNLNLKLII